jgi:hypothetical protein
MSYTSIPNQPILFNSTLPEPCEGCNNEFTQLADFNDELFWQLEAGACGSFEYVSDFISSWNKSGSTITSLGTNGAYSQDYARFDVVGNALLTVSVYNITGKLYVELLGGNSVIITAPGTHEIYLSTTDLTSANITLYFYTDTINTFNGSFAIDSLQPIPNGGLFAGLVDPETLAVVQVLDPVITTSNQYLTAAIALNDYELNAGCYRLAIADYCANTCGQYFVYNPYFNGQPLCIGCVPIGWNNNVISGAETWNVGSGQADITFVNATDQTELVSVTEFCEGVEYSVTIKVQSISNARLRLLVDGVVLQTISTAGTHTFNVTPSQSGAVSILGFSFSGVGAITLTQLSARAYKEHAIYDKYSDVINVGDYSDECRYFKIEGCNAENQFGLGFNGTSFLPGIRLEGRRFQPQYDTDTDLFRYASGRWVASYVDRRKKLNYYFGRLPEYVLDFLSIVFYFDNCYVNGVAHIPSENEFPSIEYNDADDLGALTIELYKQTDKVRKTICSGTDANCLPSILDLGSEPFILAQDGDRLLTQSNVNLYQQ